MTGNGREEITELQSASGFKEEGSLGLEVWAGFIKSAHNADLFWPTVAPLYDRIWRSDPEVTDARTVMSAMASKLEVTFETPAEIDDPTDDDKKAVDFGNQVLDDIEGGITKWFSSCMARVPFYGWGWWEAPLGLRLKDWKPPGDDDWRSQYDDGLIGYRRLAFRYYTSFYSWEINEASGRTTGMVQIDPPNPTRTIPLDKSLHVKFGDLDNPEGLATMEAIWRLERIKFGLEVILGIGFEHAAGHVSVESDKEKLSEPDKAAIKTAVRSLLTAQEGNYAAWPKGLTGKVIDVPFAAAVPLLDAIRYMGILKLATIGMQWAAMGSLSPYGSYTSMKDASEFFLTVFNSMAEGFISQADDQIGRRLYEHPTNAAAFPLMTKRPRLTVTRAQKIVGLQELGAFIESINTAGMALGDDDWIAIRRKSDFLPEALPDIAELPPEPIQDIQAGAGGEDITSPDQAEGDVTQEEEDIEMQARRTFTVSPDENPIAISDAEAYVAPEDILRAVKTFEAWAEKNDPQVAKIMRAKVVE